MRAWGFWGDIHYILKRGTHLMQQFIYYYKQLYMFRASICPSSGVLGCIRIMLLHMVFSTVPLAPTPINLQHTLQPPCNGSHTPPLLIPALYTYIQPLQQPTNAQFYFTVLNTIWSSIIRIKNNTPEDGHIDARNM